MALIRSLITTITRLMVDAWMSVTSYATMFGPLSAQHYKETLIIIVVTQYCILFMFRQYHMIITSSQYGVIL